MTPISMPAMLPTLPDVKPVVLETIPAPAPVLVEGPGTMPPLVGEPRPVVIPASATMPSGPLPPLTPPSLPATPEVKKPGAPAISSSEVALPPAAPAKTTINASPLRPLDLEAVPNPTTAVLPLPATAKSVKAPEVKVTAIPPVKVEVKDHVDEPPLAPSPGPVVTYHVVSDGETFKTIARKTLGTVERWSDIHKLNPTLKSDSALPVGSPVRLPGDACVQDEETVKPLPALRSRMTVKAKVVLPLTGTYPVTLDDHKVMMLPKAILKQLGACDTVLLSPGSDKCLWLTNQAHLDRLALKLEKSPARESDKNGFKRLYYAQTLKVPMKDGRVVVDDKLAAFAGLGQEVVLIGIDDHFEVWDAARWRRYTQAKKATSIEE